MNVPLKPELEELDRMIAEGLDDIERGDTVDGEGAFRQFRAHSAEVARSARAVQKKRPLNKP